MKAVLRNVRISPKKANLVAGLVRGAMVKDALNQLKFTPKKAADILYKVIASASANAVTNFKQNQDSLYVKEIVVTKGPAYRRGRSISKGRVHPILKKTSIITVYVDVKAPVAKADKPAKTETPAKEEETNTKQ
jgi:large subunit ribosomal protein L22